jgi:hypothetical protein
VTDRLTAVLDSNVLWSDALRRELIDAAVAGWYTPIWSDWIVAETWRILTIKWIVRQKRDPAHLSRPAKQMMRAMSPYFGLVRSLPAVGAGSWPSLGDPDDVPVWNTAVAAGADVVVSNNMKDFPPPDVSGRNVWDRIEYLTSQQFLTLIGWPPDDEDED